MDTYKIDHESIKKFMEVFEENNIKHKEAQFILFLQKFKLLDIENGKKLKLDEILISKEINIKQLDYAKEYVNKLIRHNRDDILEQIKAIGITLTKERLIKKMNPEQKKELAEDLTKHYPQHTCSTIGLIFFVLCLIYNSLKLGIEILLKDLELDTGGSSIPSAGELDMGINSKGSDDFNDM